MRKAKIDVDTAAETEAALPVGDTAASVKDAVAAEVATPSSSPLPAPGAPSPGALKSLLGMGLDDSQDEHATQGVP
jgi:hypothetical protein